MLTEEKTVFSYDELDERAKARARDWLCGAIGESFDPDFVTDEFVTICGHLGIEIETETRAGLSGYRYSTPAVYWSLGYTQGDGASFDGTLRVRDAQPGAVFDYLPADPKDDGAASLALRRAVMLVQTMVLIGLSGRVLYRDDGRGSCGVDAIDSDPWYWHGDPPDLDGAGTQATADQFDAIAQELGDCLCTYLYQSIRDEHEYQTSDEAIEETIRSNGYEFDEDGN